MFDRICVPQTCNCQTYFTKQYHSVQALRLYRSAARCQHVLSTCPDKQCLRRQPNECGVTVLTVVQQTTVGGEEIPAESLWWKKMEHLISNDCHEKSTDQNGWCLIFCPSTNPSMSSLSYVTCCNWCFLHVSLPWNPPRAFSSESMNEEVLEWMGGEGNSDSDSDSR